ncbi:hypothetical protein, partial [Escherichia coli]|uniref:hypothetical protein n=1 Tax=Escherichia coli TaxID=562 RepID=UPI001BC84822
DAMLAHLIRSTGGVGTVGRIMRSRRIRQSAHHACCYAGASYLVFRRCRFRMSAKAFPPPPVFGTPSPLPSWYVTSGLLQVLAR